MCNNTGQNIKSKQVTLQIYQDLKALLYLCMDLDLTERDKSLSEWLHGLILLLFN